MLPADRIIGRNKIPGPILRAEVNDTILVHFKNNDHCYKWSHSIYAHGVDFENNPSVFVAQKPNQKGVRVAFKKKCTYTWRVGPDSKGSWIYYDFSQPQSVGKRLKRQQIGTQLGLFGLLIVSRSEEKDEVDREFVVFYHELYKADIPSLGHNYHAVNGRCFLGNTPRFVAKVGEKIRWRLAAIGNVVHSHHIHGHQWYDINDEFVDVALMVPGITQVVEYVEDKPGKWLYHSLFRHQMEKGQVGWYLVKPANAEVSEIEETQSEEEENVEVFHVEEIKEISDKALVSESPPPIQKETEICEENVEPEATTAPIVIPKANLRRM